MQVRSGDFVEVLPDSHDQRTGAGSASSPPSTRIAFVLGVGSDCDCESCAVKAACTNQEELLHIHP